MWDHANSDITHSDWCDGVKDEDGNCPICTERQRSELAYYRPLYEGEKAAGLHGEFTEEGLALRQQRRFDETTD